MVRWALISGSDDNESVACALRVAEHLEAEGIRVGGFVQRRLDDEEGRRRYEVLHLGDHETATLEVDWLEEERCDEELPASRDIRRRGFEVAEQWLAADAPVVDVLVVGKISKHEVRGLGHGPALDAALRRSGKIVLLCARASQLFWVIERFGLREDDLVAALELPVENEPFDTFVRRLVEGCAVSLAASSIV